MDLLVTGVAGFIGMHVAEQLLLRGDKVIGIDNLNDYYDPCLKKARLETLSKYKNFFFFHMDVADRTQTSELFERESFDHVVHLAAQAGVRYSLKNPYAYGDSNLTGFLNVLEGCRQKRVKHLVYASSSSVYGGNTKLPLSERDNVDHPVSLYAATKKANELMAHTYSHLYSLPTTGLRFFTVYGPWGRPDMALFLFTKAILEQQVIEIFNHGSMRRDFTYIDDVVDSLIQTLHEVPVANKVFNTSHPDPASSWAPYRVLNIGNSTPIKLMDFICEIENQLGMPAKKKFLPLQAGDVLETYADTRRLEEITTNMSRTSLSDGIAKFIEWYKRYYSHQG